MGYDLHGFVLIAIGEFGQGMVCCYRTVIQFQRMIRNALFVVYVLTLSAVLLEAAVRVWGYSEQYICDPIYMPFSGASDIPYVHKPNLVQARASGLAVTDTDHWGLRTIPTRVPHTSKQKNEYRIAVVGDSVTFGTGVSKTEDTFAYVLETRLNRKQTQRTVRVFNYGTLAYSVKQMAATLRHRVPDVQPDLVLMAIIPQDFNVARTPSVNSAGYLDFYTTSAGVLSPDSIFKRILHHMHSAYLFRDVIYSSFNLRRRDTGLSAGELPDSYEYIPRFKQTAQSYHLSYSIVLLPEQQSHFGRVAEQMERDHIAFVDLWPLHNEFTSEEFRASQFDAHPSARVHHRIGEALADYVFNRYF
jgi:hypothetical protein